jgi:hypothetical protein
VLLAATFSPPPILGVAHGLTPSAARTSAQVTDITPQSRRRMAHKDGKTGTIFPWRLSEPWCVELPDILTDRGAPKYPVTENTGLTLIRLLHAPDYLANRIIQHTG